MISKLLSLINPFPSLIAPVSSAALNANITGNPYKVFELPPKKESDRLADPFDEVIRVMSFNILSDNHTDHAWEQRKMAVISMIRFHRADLIGLQEASRTQIQDLASGLPEYEIFEGIFNPILYRKSRFEKIKTGAFYLSSTPDLPSVGWDASFPRSVSWIQLKDKKGETSFYLFNTHFDYHGANAREQSAHVLKRKIAEIALRTPFVITGDFNLFPELSGQKTYDVLTETFKDAFCAAHFPHHGPTGTWSGFKEAGQPGIKPDCIFVGPGVEVHLHGILSDTFDGKFPSDHLPVVADLRFF